MGKGVEEKGVRRKKMRRSWSPFSGCALMHVSVLRPQISHNPPHSHELKAVCVCHCHPERSKPSAGTKDRHKIKV